MQEVYYTFKIKKIYKTKNTVKKYCFVDFLKNKFILQLIILN